MLIVLIVWAVYSYFPWLVFWYRAAIYMKTWSSLPSPKPHQSLNEKMVMCDFSISCTSCTSSLSCLSCSLVVYILCTITFSLIPLSCLLILSHPLSNGHMIISIYRVHRVYHLHRVHLALLPCIFFRSRVCLSCLYIELTNFE